MRNTRIFGFALATAAVSLLAACGGSGSDSASGGDVKLTVSTFVTEDHPSSAALKEWMEQVTEKTDGAIEFEEFYNGSLCSAPDTIACAEDGTADIVMAVPAYNPEMTMANIGSVSFQTPDLQANGDALNKLYAENADYRAGYEERGLTMLYTFDNSMAVLASVDELNTLDDLDGLTVRASGATSSGLAVLGVNPVATDPAEIYEALERGVVAGAAFPLESVVDYRLGEVAPNIYDLGEFMGSYAMNTFTMNLNSFESLSDEQQKVLAEVSEDISGRYIADWLEPSIVESCKAIIEEGGSVERLGPVETGDAWAEKAGAEQRAAWEKSAADLTDDPSAMFDDYLSFVEEADSGEARTTFEICESA